jgi:hypothetical protein
MTIIGQTPLPTVENTPVVNNPGAVADQGVQVTPAVQTPAPSYVTQEMLNQMIADVEKRVVQSSKDAAKATVNKAMGVHVAPAVVTPAPVAPTLVTPTAPVPQVPVTQELASAPIDPVLSQAYALLQKDGVDPTAGVSAEVLEVYKMQAVAGVHLTAADPELAMIKSGSMLEYLSTTAEAVNAARQRKIADGSISTESDPLSLLPMTATGNQSNRPAHVSMSGTQTLDSFFSKKG